jgi:hypothetical protein
MRKNSMARSVTFRPNNAVFDAMTKWLEQHPYLDKTTLMNMAVMKFVSTTQTLAPIPEETQLVVARPEEVNAALDKVLEEHKTDMEILRKS